MLRWVWLAAVVAGALLRAPGLASGFREDDYVQRAMLEGAFPIERGAADLFWFAGRDAAEGERLRDAGYLPWWSSSGLRLAMLRPLSSLLVAFDHALWPDEPLVQHLHSLAWWALLVGAATLVLGRALAPASAAVACVLYALEGAHLVPLAWLANRSTLVASSFAMLALWLHLKWREDRLRAGPWLVASAASLALAGGEYAFSVLAYVGAYELAARRDPLRLRALALLPVALPSVAYVALRTSLGHGVRDSAVYVSPLDPAFGDSFAPRVSALVADLAFGIPALWSNLGRVWLRLLIATDVFSAETLRELEPLGPSPRAMGVAAFTVLGALYLWARRRRDEGQSRLGWLVLGAFLSLVPAASALPNDRVLVGGSFGIAALIARATVAGLARGRAEGLARRSGAALVAVACLLVHLALPARSALARAKGLAAESETFRIWARMAQIPLQGVEQLHVMVVSAADFTTAANLPWLRRAEGLGVPRSYRRLSGAFGPHELTLVRDDTIELRALGAPARLSFDALYRPADQPIAPGFRVALPGMRVEVLEAHRGIPVRTRFVFDEPLAKSKRYLFLQAMPDGLVAVRLPRKGETVRIEVAWFPRLGEDARETLRHVPAGAGVSL